MSASSVSQRNAVPRPRTRPVRSCAVVAVAKPWRSDAGTLIAKPLTSSTVILRVRGSYRTLSARGCATGLPSRSAAYALCESRSMNRHPPALQRVKVGRCPVERTPYVISTVGTENNPSLGLWRVSPWTVPNHGAAIGIISLRAIPKSRRINRRSGVGGRRRRAQSPASLRHHPIPLCREVGVQRERLCRALRVHRFEARGVHETQAAAVDAKHSIECAAVQERVHKENVD